MSKLGVLEFGFGFLTEDFPEHSDDYWEIHAVYRGSGKLITAETAIPLNSKVFMVSPPEERHRLEVDSPLVFHIVRVKETGDQGDLFGRLARLCAERGGLAMDDADHYRFRHWKALSASPSDDAKAALWYGLVAYLNELAIDSPGSTPNGAGDFVSGTVRYMEQHVQEKLSLDELAGQAGLTRFQLAHRFKERVGLSPIDFFLRMKVEAACYLLGESDRSSKEIADWLGFTDEFYFSKLFKAKTGRTPRQYRRNTVGREEPLMLEMTLGAKLRGRHGN